MLKPHASLRVSDVPPATPQTHSNGVIDLTKFIGRYFHYFIIYILGCIFWVTRHKLKGQFYTAAEIAQLGEHWTEDLKGQFFPLYFPEMEIMDCNV